jgi:hypothetical protein
VETKACLQSGLLSTEAEVVSVLSRKRHDIM